MPLEFDGLFGEGRGIFKNSPEDDQVSKYAGARIIPTEQPSDTVTLTPLEGALNTLELQAAAAILPGDYLELKMDIFTDADGYLDTLDVSSTSAFFDTDKYKNDGETTSVRSDTSIGIHPDNFTLTYAALKPGYITQLGLMRWYGEVTGTLTVKQGGDTLATKAFVIDSTNGITVTLTSGDYSRPITIGAFTIEVVGDDDMALSDPHSGATSGFSFASQAYPMENVADAPTVFITAGEDKIVQTDAIAIPAGFGNFQIVAFRQTTAGTGTVTADISFNGGSTYQTGVAVNTNHAIVTSGTSMIVKLNLNAGASEGLAEFKGWGVQLWA